MKKSRKNLDRIFENSKKNLDRIFEYTNIITKKGLDKALIDGMDIRHLVPPREEIILLGIEGDYLDEFGKTIKKIENKITSTLGEKQRSLTLKKDGPVSYLFTPYEINKLKKEIAAISCVFKGLEYTKADKIDQALVSYCDSIVQDQEPLFSYLGLASTIGYLSELNKRLMTIGLSINTGDLKQSLPMLSKLFCEQNLTNYAQADVEINQSYFNDLYGKILNSLMDIILKRDDFEGNLLKVGKSANEVFTMDEDIVEKLYIIKRARKDNKYKKGNLRLESAVLKYFNSVSTTMFGSGIENNLEVPQPIRFDPNFDEDYNYLILTRKKGRTLLSLLNQKVNLNSIIAQFTEQIAKIHAIGPMHLIKKRKYFTKEADFRRQLKSYCAKASWDNAQTKDLMRVIAPIIRIIVNSRDFGFVKDANLENAIYTKDGRVIPIDFEEIKYAPLQYDLAKMFIFSFKQKDQYLDSYIEKYNDTLEKFRSCELDLPKKCEAKKRLIHDNNDFKFTFLNYTVFDAILTYLNPKYDENSEIKKRALSNAMESIDELLTKYDSDWYKESYAEKDWHKRSYSNDEKGLILELRDTLENFKNSLG